MIDFEFGYVLKFLYESKNEIHFMFSLLLNFLSLLRRFQETDPINSKRNRADKMSVDFCYEQGFVLKCSNRVTIIIFMALMTVL